MIHERLTGLKSIIWIKLFLFCLGLFFASGFAMKWLEPNLIYNQEPVSILGLELSYSSEKIEEIFSGISTEVATILKYHLRFDFIFMAGCFPGIACLCMLTAKKMISHRLKIILYSLAFLQIFAWSFDIIENYFLLKWLSNPAIGQEFSLFRIVVFLKWIIALTGALLSAFYLAKKEVEKLIVKQSI